ncbi:MAG: hypothetical protein ACRDQ9_05015 [Pseudonocardiaceae bacterium]
MIVPARDESRDPDVTSRSATENYSASDLPGRRRSVFDSLREALSREDLDGVVHCAVKIRNALPNRDRLEDNVVLVAYGGGKDSSYTLAFARAVQLLLVQVYGSTFSMRVVTNRHAGMPTAVMDNIQRAYRVLDLFDDPQCQLLLIDGHEVHRFDATLPQSEHVVRRNRTDILMTGHRTFADARPTFCNACNLSMVNSFGLAASIDGGADLIITGDSQREQRDYYLWVNRLATRFGVATNGTRKAGFRGFLTAADTIAQAYFTDIHGADNAEATAERRVVTNVPEELRFFSIYDDTVYSSGGHWQLLTEFLGFQFDDIAFSFTESDCGNPALMAHLRGLKAERLQQRSYSDGLSEYVTFALSLMRRKEFPNTLIDIMQERYGDNSAFDRMRKRMDEYAKDTYGLTEQHLICMVYSPFAGEGAGLETYLAREQPALANRIEEIRTLLGTEDRPEALAEVVSELERISGLDLQQLRVLYDSPLRTPSAAADGNDLLGAILDGDPHKDVIRTRNAPNGPIVLEMLSGR